MNSYESLAKSECHKHIELLVCSFLFPACIEGSEITLPCRDFCRDVKKSCGSFMEKARLSWPFYFDCIGLPRRRRGWFCISHKFKASDLEKLRPSPVPVETEIIEKPIVVNPIENVDPTVGGGIYPTNSIYRNREGIPYFTEPAIVEYETCEKPILFSTSEQNMARMWVLVGACSALSLAFIMTFVTFAHGHLNKPENIITTLNLCLSFQSLGFLITAILPQAAFSCSVKNDITDPVYIRSTSPSTVCLITFSTVYFASVAGNLWWVTLTILWLLMLCLNWGENSIFKVFRYIHLIIWGLSGGLTITALTLKAVEGDELLGGCFAGAISTHHLATYDITPNCVLICIGGVVLICGLVTLLKISKIDGYKHITETSFNKLKKTALFSFLYFIISLIKILCQFYELSFRNQWYQNCYPSTFTTNATSSTVGGNGTNENATYCGPDYRIFILKYTAYLALPVLVCVYLVTAVSFVDFIKKLSPIAKTYHARPGETKV